MGKPESPAADVAQLSDFINHLFIGILVIAADDRRILYTNDTLQRLVGRVPAAGLPCHKALFGCDTACSFCCLADESAIEQPVVKYVAPMKKYLLVRFFRTVWHGVPALIEYVEDVTERELARKKQQEELTAFRAKCVSIRDRLHAENKIISYYHVDVTTNTILDGICGFSKESLQVPSGRAIPWLIDNAARYFIYPAEAATYREQLSEERIRDAVARRTPLVTDEFAVEIDGKMMYFSTQVDINFDPTLKHDVAYIYSLDRTEKAVKRQVFSCINRSQFEWILWHERSGNCTVICEKPVGIGLKSGKHQMPFTEYKCRMRRYLATESLSLFAAREAEYDSGDSDVDKDHPSSHVYTVSEADGRRRYLRVTSFYFDDLHRINCAVAMDVTTIMKKERAQQRKLAETAAKLEAALTATEQAQLRAEQAAEEAEKLKAIAERKREDAREANAAKSEFLSRMSHDMRTPLGAVISLANFGMGEIHNPRAQEYFRKIKDSSEYLLALMNDVLEMQQLEYGKIELSAEVISLDEISRQVETIVRQRAEQKHVKLFLHFDYSGQPRYFRLDKIRTQQVLINILNNAIKYTPAGGVVTWKNKITQRAGGQYIVTHTIADTGLGMSQAFQARMFEPFSKEPNRLSKSEGGAGLGLAITKNLVDTMGGRIQCHSESDVGTTFTISLPCDVPTVEEIDAYEPKVKTKCCWSASFKGKRILLCEDVAINVKIARRILETAEICVDVAKNGADGVRMAQNGFYDAILMDIRMPVMDGLTAAKKIRLFDQKTPIIALSANAYQEDVEKSLVAGMNAHLSKPVSREKLFQTLNELL